MSGMRYSYFYSCSINICLYSSSGDYIYFIVLS